MNAQTTVGTGKPRSIWPVFLILLALILIFMFGPMISMLTASGIAGFFGCDLDEGSVHACVIAGVDFGETLYTMAMMAWFALFTLPFGGLALLVWLVALIVTLALRRYMAREQR